MRIGEGMLLNNISGLIGFVLNAGKGIPTLDLADRGMGNTVTVEDAARLEGMSLYQGALVTRENASVTFSGTEAKRPDNGTLAQTRSWRWKIPRWT